MTYMSRLNLTIEELPIWVVSFWEFRFGYFRYSLDVHMSARVDRARHEGVQQNRLTAG